MPKLEKVDKLKHHRILERLKMGKSLAQIHHATEAVKSTIIQVREHQRTERTPRKMKNDYAGRTWLRSDKK